MLAYVQATLFEANMASRKKGVALENSKTEGNPLIFLGIIYIFASHHSI
jgi:hypothetical protein